MAEKEKTQTEILRDKAKEEMEKQRRSYPPVMNATPLQLARAFMRPKRKKK